TFCGRIIGLFHHKLNCSFRNSPFSICPLAAFCKEEQLKDTEPLNKMIDLLREYDGLRNYRLPQTKLGSLNCGMIP
ncbi:MAG TPA: hypothetical protein VJ888_06950, partial [Mobilitalea sp.]|nr:hypothetical protein [Mobilitalea sp.]